MTEPPWDTQKYMAEQVIENLKSLDQAKRAHSHLQLAVMYHIGYGLELDDKLALEHLYDASIEDPIAQCLLLPVARALASHDEIPLHSLYTDSQDREPRFSQDLRQRSSDIAVETTIPELDSSESKIQWRRLRFSSEGSVARGSDGKSSLFNLTTAFRRGDYDTAISLAPHRLDCSTDNDAPNFCHWLIFFDSSQAQKLLEIISCNWREDRQNSGPPIHVPGHCMQLFGTPLH